MIKPIKFEYSTKIVSKKAFEDHIKLYHGYVEKANEILQELDKNPKTDKAHKNYSHFRGLKKDLNYNLNGVIHHELFFGNLGGKGKEIGQNFVKLAQKCFGSFENWKKDFCATAKSARGWAIACYEQRTGKLQNIMLDAHDEGMVTSSYPLIAIDMYEHTYALDYGTDTTSYIYNFFDDICWETVKKRMVALDG